jgi:hypothetical protein
MNNRRNSIHLLAAIGVCAAAWTAPAQALSMSVQPSRIYQYSNTANVYVGHTVAASTNMNQLEAGGSFRASCISPDTGEITGSRSLPASNLIGGLQLYVTIPAQLPALKPMPGFANVPRGATLSCTYAWTAFAKEATYSIGVPGLSMPVGGQQATASTSISFTMRKPGTSTGNDDACIP